jgi:hypothetical protein
LGKAEHLGGKVDTIQVKVLPEGKKIGAMGTANVEQATFLPPACQRLQFTAEYRPVPEVIPAWGYLIEYVFYYLTPYFERGRASL